MELIYRTVDPESPGGMKISVGEAKLGSERFDKHNKRIFEGDLVRATDPQTGDVIEGPVEFYWVASASMMQFQYPLIPLISYSALGPLSSWR